MDHLSEQAIAALARHLDEAEARIGKELETAQRASSDLPVGEVEDEADVAFDTETKAMGEAMLQRHLAQLRDIAAARERIKAGVYGVCADCGSEIDYARLEAYPTAKRCTACQRHHERLFAPEAAA
ncbi:TraR/DksA family transcriptional regulator [Pandoraea sp.]|uniref:TraR/DksA family transcriptional regulator n=1 Tax=Pandoraea sp. TaxID=1883445 RepID=UPI0011FEF53E|nr:TraR/DksA family transcriptional regulator [Pandoraea sp.]MBU6491845.1 TraR/DksA family transcriptional regulator [Burkholderiales bacterium]MDE2289452.1 TraR/DksA family transcriptional regulator [Burkholderiales bacterium]MDE2608812.1 TraR/DksA family transcriptional regulator [Burkholderiales bacterium]TAL55037.1 MAG: TraR/DksA family transcriptional regulator [Pandoraea sp.]TAM19914.1 MAG: TraR/DksA family transcriptional regulator [Pandoraea sp.]